MELELSTFDMMALGFSLILSGFYSGSESALVSISVDRTKQLIEEGGPKGKALEFASKHTNEILTTILVGNNIVNIFAASLTTSIANKFFKNDALAISVGFTTVLILIFGEIIPKTFSRGKAEKLVVPVIKILQINYYIFYPVIEIFTWIIEKVLGKNAELSGRLVTRNDIEFLVSKAEKEKTIDSKQIDLLNSILEFPTIKVKDIMIPRTQVNSIQHDITLSELKNYLKNHNHSRYPVCEGELDNTLGFLHVKDLVFLNNDDPFNIDHYLKAPFFIYEHMRIQAVFDYMNRKKVHLSIVKDENGIIVGIVTLEDIVEEIFGEIHDEHDKQLVKDEKNSRSLTEGILVEGNISLRELYNDFDVKIPLNDNYSTLAGFMLDRMGNNFPTTGMIIFWEGYSFKLEEVENYEIKKVRITDVEGEKHLYSKKLAHKESEE